MTQKARAVLSACELALTELEADPTQEIWKLRWFTAVALLRAVGHVLLNVDKASGDAPMKVAIDAAWQRWQNDRTAHSIFWDFIQEERNNALKEFRFGAGQGVVIEPPAAQFERDQDGALTQTNPGEKGRTWHTYTITRGPFAGRDQRDIVRQAIRWWQEQLDCIDGEAV